MSQNDRFNSGMDNHSGLDGKSSGDLSKFNPSFKTLDQNEFGDKAPSLDDLKNNETRQIKAPNDRYKHFDFKENLNIRSAFIIIAIWLAVRFLVKVFAHGDPQAWYTMSFNPEMMPGMLHDFALTGGSLIGGFLQIFFSSIIAPLMFNSWKDFFINAIFLCVICWAAKSVKVDDVRILKTYLMTTFGTSFSVFGLYRLVMLALSMTGIVQGTWVESLRQSTSGVFGLQIGIVGLWIFILLQILFERTRIPAYAEGMDKIKKHRSIAILITAVAGILYCFFMARPGDIEPKSLYVFAIVLVVVSFVIGFIRGLLSYSTMDAWRARGRE